MLRDTIVLLTLFETFSPIYLVVRQVSSDNHCQKLRCRCSAGNNYTFVQKKHSLSNIFLLWYYLVHTQTNRILYFLHWYPMSPPHLFNLIPNWYIVYLLLFFTRKEIGTTPGFFIAYTCIITVLSQKSICAVATLKKKWSEHKYGEKNFK